MAAAAIQRRRRLQSSFKIPTISLHTLALLAFDVIWVYGAKATTKLRELRYVCLLCCLIELAYASLAKGWSENGRGIKERDQIKISKLNEVEIYFTSRSIAIHSDLLLSIVVIVVVVAVVAAHFLDFVLCSSFIIRHILRMNVCTGSRARPRIRSQSFVRSFATDVCPF